MLPKIQDSFLDTVVFLYASKSDAQNGVKTGGSGFLVGIWSHQQKVVHIYVVTNRHVAEGGCSVVRLTSRQKETEIKQVESPDGWLYPTGGDDLAAWHMATQIPSQSQNYAFVPIQLAVHRQHDYGPGDDCFMLGRFVTKDGKQKNQPSARFGNISMLPQEPFETRKGVLVDAFLVETRSQAGYSGSPVFVYRKGMTVKLPIRDISAYKASVTKVDLKGEESFDMRLLGIDFAHLPNLACIGMANAEGNKVLAPQHPLLPEDARVELGSGMLAVVPAWKLVEMLAEPEAQSVRESPTSNDPVIDGVSPTPTTKPSASL